MKVSNTSALEVALTEYLQPKMDKHIDLQTWARISASGEWGADEELLGDLNADLDGLRGISATSYEMACPGEPWVPTCRISMMLTIRNVEIGFDVILVRSEIVALDFGEEDFLHDLLGVDLAREFAKKQTFAAMSRPKAEG